MEVDDGDEDVAVDGVVGVVGVVGLVAMLGMRWFS